MQDFERKYSPGYRHVICIGKTKSTSEKRLSEAYGKSCLPRQVRCFSCKAYIGPQLYFVGCFQLVIDERSCTINCLVTVTGPKMTQFIV